MSATLTCPAWCAEHSVMDPLDPYDREDIHQSADISVDCVEEVVVRAAVLIEAG